MDYNDEYPTYNSFKDAKEDKPRTYYIITAFGIGFICGAGCLLLGELILAFIFKK